MSDHSDMMMDLFRSEVESHAESLTTALLALENDATATERIDAMMRAAHSVKGAARIVQIEPAVQVSHVMEDCFVAAQRSEIVLRPSGIDVLLKGVDMLSQISAESRHNRPDWSHLQPRINHLVHLLEQVRAGQEPSDDAISGHAEPEPEPTQSHTPNERPSVIDVLPKAIEGGNEHIEATEESRPDDTITTIHFPKLLNADSAELIRQELVSVLNRPAVNGINLDLSSTTDMDAIGLAFIDAIAKHATAYPNVSVSITSASPAIERVIQCLDANKLMATRS